MRREERPQLWIIDPILMKKLKSGRLKEIRKKNLKPMDEVLLKVIGKDLRIIR